MEPARAIVFIVRAPLHVLVAGGGVAALEAVMALRALAGRSVRITLVAPGDKFVYRPLSVAEPFALGETASLPLARIARDFAVELRQASLASVDASDGTAWLDDGTPLSFDRLIVAIGAPRVPVYPHALTFRGEDDVSALRALIEDLGGPGARRIAFVVPPGASWPLPAYELALMTARRAAEQRLRVEVLLVTPEERALGIFGGAASRDVHRALNAAGIQLECGAIAGVPSPDRVVIHPGNKVIDCDRVVALSVVEGPWVSGLPADREGFLPIDLYGRVGGLENVHACGDGTNFPLKQGGIACQQADAAASWIAAAAGADVEAEPFRPVLRGQLFTGDAPQFMRHNVSGRTGKADESGVRPLWWPPTKVAGKYISGYLAGQDATTVEQSQAKVKRIALTHALDGAQEIPLRGYEFAARWSP